MSLRKRKRRLPSYKGLRAASGAASKAARGASRKDGTKCEVALRRELRKLGLHFSSNVATLPGCPDIVFTRERVAVFSDGDFWHGRGLRTRVARLAKGHNGKYWVQKIRSNVVRDNRVRLKLRRAGWSVLRVWESDIHTNPRLSAERIAATIDKRT